ncbi:tubulin-like doman-containing protein [Gordonia sp. (in: high G+C Gram-positive bacteria)]|uniref:tubulin-like doman-containing protein n=1 Tax=Gordonia sp. (in: high G+C Gram-positive bacteria) TaxID=84139 RepID=UPI0039E61096
MKRFLVVGCGGSGGAALAYMMDQLKSDLRSHGIDKLPAGWQFVHLDVPTSPTPVQGVGTVPDQGGVYVGTGPESDSYKVLDNAMSQRLVANGELDTIATWAPREPETVYTPLSTGAGQYRALGRMITLSRVDTVRKALQRAWDELFANSTDSEMRSLKVPGAGGYSSNDQPIVLVVSSMAGGAGASMALDVCRILTLVQGVDPRLMGVFMVTPDIFETLPDSAITGTRANALAMLGEIVASQTGSARETDVALLRALGHEKGEGERIPFARVFPVGRYVGAQRTVFGDGTPNAVYRGLGRGLAGLVLSGSATQQFVEWDLTNAVGDQGSLEYLGWGNKQWNNVPWGTFGYASLSMGRDRYAEYSAQRLARSSVDKLLHGHLQPGNDSSDEEQVNAILDNQWSNICYSMGLPDTTDASSTGLAPWLTTTVLPADQVSAQARNVVNTCVRPMIDQTPGVNGEQWAARVQQVLAERRHALAEGANAAAYNHAFGWHQHFVTQLEQATARALATQGLPYATGLVKRVARLLDDVLLPALTDLSKYGPADIADLPPEVKATLASLSGTIANPAPIADEVFAGSARTVERQIYAALAHHVANACGAMVTEVFDPLIDALNEAQTLLRQAAGANRQQVGLALLQTDEYAAWPADSDELVAERFSEADNEVMLTRSAEFKGRYEIDLPASVGATSTDPRLLGEGISRAAGHVITGFWTTVDGSKSPAEERPVVERTTTWISRAFPRHPETGDGLIAQRATYDIHVRPPELLDRARRFVARTGESFDRFCSVSLRQYVEGEDAPESERVARRTDLELRFGEAVNLARPLASVNENAMQAIHGVAEMVYRYKFSAIPFLGLPVAGDLKTALSTTARVDKKSADALTNALTDEAKIKRIDIFGSYPNYSPLAYEAVIEPAARQWLASSPGQRKAFWTMRRARPLQASLPMHENERRAMVGGWVLGQALGMIQVPAEPFTEAVHVWDTQARTWLPFPNPLLTPPAEFLAEYDWLPAVLESVLVAIAQSHQPPVMSSMAPYRALRHLFDAGAENPSTGLEQRQLAATVNMANWLRGGETGTGVAAAIPESGPGVSIKDRAERLRAYLAYQHEFVSKNYMEPGEGASPGNSGAEGGGTFSTITVRQQASKTPIYRDIAADIFWATNELMNLLGAAVALAEQGVSSGPTITPTVQQPDSFTPPTMDTPFDVPPMAPPNTEPPQPGGF